MINKPLLNSANRAIKLLQDNNLTLSTAESCTGGLLATVITEFSGASKIFSLGIVSYSNEIKNQELGVPTEILKNYGAISCETVTKMAEGIRIKANSDFGISVTGVAGPNASEGHPAGYVYIAVSSKIAKDVAAGSVLVSALAASATGLVLFYNGGEIWHIMLEYIKNPMFYLYIAAGLVYVSGILFIPIILIMTEIFGLLGVQSAQGIADVLAFFISAPIAIRFLKRLPQDDT